ncbi:PAS domain-containing protein [Roseovarius sp. D22-M7]|uniref:PAS domain-containing protein n=1 Tax=Roseovarius sp. D22-M7 TaxID=3127116 RepID=UPI00300FDCA1
MRQDDLTLQDAEADAAAHLNAHLRAFRAHWDEARRGDDVPYRAHIDPRRIAPLLPNAFVAERIAPGVTRLRIAGLHLSELMGMEVRGMPLCSLIAPAAREAFALHLVDLFDRPATLRMELLGKGGLGRPELRGTLLMLPLRSDLGDVSRALGCLVTTGATAPGRTPRRFEIVNTRISAVDGAGDTGAFRVVAGGARLRAPDRSAGRAHLRVVT